MTDAEMERGFYKPRDAAGCQHPQSWGAEQLPLTPSGGPSPADTLTSELGEDTFL